MGRADFQEPTVLPTISLGAARAAYLGPGLDLSPHQNAAATIAISLEKPFRLALRGTGDEHESRAIALIPPNTLHHIVSAGPMAFVYLDALSDDHRTLQSVDLDRAHAHIAGEWPAAMHVWNVDSLCSALGVPPRRACDTRIAGAIRRLDASPEEFPRIADLAALVSLSPSRFQALFRREVGMPFRRYRLWRRMALVMRRLSNGVSLTQAAYEAGFASSAHLSTAFREMFGLTPSSLVKLGARIDVVDDFERRESVEKT